MRALYRWRNAQYVSALYEAAEIFNLIHKTKWVKMPNHINMFLGR